MNVIGEVKGKTCILIDDIIDTGGTLVAATEALLAEGAVKVYACATHAVFSDDALQKLENSRMEKIVVTNTIDHPEIKASKKIIVLSIGELLGKSICNIVKDEPISQIFENIYKDRDKA